jgi:nucleotide-binding universal stress UspA family protein
LKAFVEKNFQDFPVHESKVVIGDPADEIIKYVESAEIDLVITGTHGRRGFDFFLYGSVARAIVGNSPVPVLTVNPYRKRKSGPPPMYWKGN